MRQRLLGWFCLWLLLSASAFASAQTAPKILVLGDSLSAGYGIDVEDGWVELLERRLEREGFPHQVVNASVSGETTEGGLKRLPRLLEAHQPEWVILELGGNDGLRGYPVDEMRSNLEDAVALSREAGAKVLVLGIQIPPNYGRRYTDQFTAVYPALAEEKALPLVPFMLEGIATRQSLMQRDGIHPNADAQPLILDNVWPVLKPLLRPSP
ncbi:arylesterase [Marinimicrobium agarilyticum]|uniref:arylesterase n=1 Tax=Marinimicrobium agarilyticum TaxID=306546 RepID=UPI00040D77F2|nr:arylesterase [Marinimicrobium agarilyticum]